ncbi:MAG: hypothetical protein KGL39_06350 [Patescibacteria group bacterium]|nr:hypothetical protein [Patescibacteria group bacterium]
MNTSQKLALTIGILGFVATGGTQLTDIFAPFGSMAPLIVKEIVSVAGFVSGVLGIVLTFLTGQAQTVKAVQDMPGVESITVNEKANKTLASLALDQTQEKIDVVPSAAQAVKKIAQG